MQYVTQVIVEFWNLSREMAPYLLLGFVAAALLRAFIDESFVRRHLGRKGWLQTIKAAVIGVPLPLCSCGVIPVAASLHRQGGSKGAVTSFTASTPQTGVDSIFATAALLNWPFALVRVVVAFVNGVLAGTLVDRFADREEPTSEDKGSGATNPTATHSCCSHEEPPVSSCCGHGHEAEPAETTCGCGCHGEKETVTAPTTGSCGCCDDDHGEMAPATAAAACCHSESRASVETSEVPAVAACCSAENTPAPVEACGCHHDDAPAGAAVQSCCSQKPAPATTSCCASGADSTADTPTSRLAEGFRFGLVTLPADIGKALLFGLFLAAVLAVVLPKDLSDSTWTHGFLAYLGTTLIAVPIYVCSTGSIPMAFALVHAGFSPGAALVFLIAGPATNTATVSALWKMIGARSVVIYLATLILVAWVSGFLLDQSGLALDFRGGHMHAEGIAWWKTLSAVVLFGVLLAAFWKPWDRFAARSGARA